MKDEEEDGGRRKKGLHILGHVSTVFLIALVIPSGISTYNTMRGGRRLSPFTLARALSLSLCRIFLSPSFPLHLFLSSLFHLTCSAREDANKAIDATSAASASFLANSSSSSANLLSASFAAAAMSSHAFCCAGSLQTRAEEEVVPLPPPSPPLPPVALLSPSLAVPGRLEGMPPPPGAAR